MSNATVPINREYRTTIVSLPDEILLSILGALKQVSKQSLVRSLQTCSQWYRLGKGLLWKDIVLDPRNSDKLLRCLISPTTTFTATLASTTRSLTVLIHHSPLPDHLLISSMEALARAVTYLRSLTTFSLTQIASPVSPWDIAAVTA